MTQVKVCEACGALVPDDVIVWTRHRDFHRRTDRLTPEGFDVMQI